MSTPNSVLPCPDRIEISYDGPFINKDKLQTTFSRTVHIYGQPQSKTSGTKLEYEALQDNYVKMIGQLQHLS